jgi:uncharacterized protein (DUF3820 family)
MKMPFGKYKGTELANIAEDNPGYIVWLKKNVDLTGELKTFVDKNYRKCEMIDTIVKHSPDPDDMSRSYDRKEWIEEHGGDPEEYGWTEAWGWDYQSDDY